MHHIRPLFSQVARANPDLIAELAKNRFIIYCCLRDIRNTGYPPRSRIADLLLPTTNDQLDEKLGRIFPKVTFEFEK